MALPCLSLGGFLLRGLLIPAAIACAFGLSFDPVGFAVAPALAAESEEVGDEHVDTETDEGHASDAEEHGDHAFNWFYGMLGARDADTEPSLLFRPKGMPVPFLAQVLNASILFGGLFWLGRKSLKDGLKKRRQQIMQGMDDAARMRKEAHAQLTMYQEKLAHIEAEVERLRKEMREVAEVERSKILAEAKERRVRMERDAKLLIEHELKAAHDELLKATVSSAIESAGKLLSQQVSADDHRRLEQESIGTLGAVMTGFKRGQA